MDLKFNFCLVDDIIRKPNHRQLLVFSLSDVGLISSVFDNFSDGFGFVFLGFTAEDMVTLV